ncbi:SPOR domain-containing protein [Aromatoleum aromaticum]|nr:SPOR domain-containing protein [Aromatoleum aromaticum]
MPAMRLIFIVLILSNLLAFASTRGWLGAAVPDGEPERLTNQLNPGRIILHPQQPASDRAQARAAEAEPTAPAPAIPPFTAPATELPLTANSAAHQPDVASVAVETPVEPLACAAYRGLAGSQADALTAQAQAVAGLQVERTTTSAPSAWWVRIPPEGGRDGADRKVTELRALGIRDYFIVHEAGPNQFAVSLGLFKTEAKAQQHLAFLRTKRVRGAGVTPRHAPVYRIEIRGPSAALATFDKSRGAAQAGAAKTGCNP